MIRYTLRCENDHHFESWFQSGPEFERLRESGGLGCALCGSLRVDKALMAPQVRPARKAATGAAPQAAEAAAPPPAPPVALGTRPLATPGSALEAMLAEIRRAVEATSDYVGADFAVEARRIHEGEAPSRSIFGEADAEEARALVEDGIPVAALPWASARKLN
jgi:hypothetical protein